MASAMGPEREGSLQILYEKTTLKLPPLALGIQRRRVAMRQMVWQWAMLLFVGGLLLQACQNVPHDLLPDASPPPPLVVPAGGVYRTLPEAIQLVAEGEATLHYRWGGEPERLYTGPIRPPHLIIEPLTLHVWTQTASGQRGLVRREHYIQDPGAPHVEVLALDRSILAPTQTATLHWRSTAAAASYELTITQRGWGPGRRVAQGRVVPGVAQHTVIPGTALFAGENRLWLRVQSDAGGRGATSRLLMLRATPATTRAWPASGVFGQPQTVRLVTARPASIYYTIDGSAPSLASARYTAPLRIERSTRLRYFSVDPYDNRESWHEEHYEIQASAPTLVLRTLPAFEVGGDTPVAFSWQSDTAGRYEVVLQNPQQHRGVTVQQGSVSRQREMRTTIGRNFLTTGDWRVELHLQPSDGFAARLSFTLRVQYLETFADTRYLDVDATTAVWEPSQRHVQLPRGPRLLGTYPTRGRSRRVTVRDGLAYLANGRGGLHIVDVLAPQQPRRTGLFYPHGSAVALAKYQQYVYLAVGDSGLAVLDVTQPTTPRLAATVPLPEPTTDIAIAAPYAYVGTQQGSLYILDLMTPLRPHVIGQVNVGGQVVDIAVAGTGVVYLACLDRGLSIVDARHPRQPRVLRQWPTASAATGVALQGQQVYVAAGVLEVLDVGQPEAPRRRKSPWVQGAYGVAAQSAYVVVATGTDGITVLPIPPADALQTLRTRHYAARLAWHDTTLLVADTRGGLQLFDFAESAQPHLLAGLDDVGTIVDVVVDGHFAYLADDRRGSGLVIVDLRSPTAPRIVGRYVNEATTDVKLWNQLALLSDAAGVLHVVDIQNPTQPRLIGSLSMPGNAQCLALLPPYVLVASDQAGVHVVDLSQPEWPVLQTTVSLSGRVLDMVMVDHMAYIATLSGGIQTVDFRTPVQPLFVDAYHHVDNKGDAMLRLIAAGSRVYAIDSERGLQILNGLPAGPLHLQGSLAFPEGAPWALTVVDPYVFISTLLNTLYVVDASNPVQPHLISSAPYGGAGLYATDQYLYMAVRGQRGVPGGLRVLETFATVSQDLLAPFQARGAQPLPGRLPNTMMINRAFTVNAPGTVQSTMFSPRDVAVHAARLQVDDFWGVSGHIHYELSNDGGVHWDAVQPGVWHLFAESGADLRWRATLLSADLMTTPLIETVWIDYTTDPQGGQKAP